MNGLSHEEFIDICRKKVNLGKYLEPCIKYYHDGKFDNFDGQTGEKVNIHEDAKNLFSVLKLASQTEIGKQIFEELDSNTKVSFIIDEQEKENCFGYSNNDHFVALTDPKRHHICNAATILHELTHELQKQQGGNSINLPTEQDRFMTNKMMEAEARLNKTIATHQLIPLMQDAEESEKFASLLSADDIRDVFEYHKLQKSGASQEDITRQMLQNFYKNENWNIAYNKQAEEEANYQLSQHLYLQQHVQDPEKIKKRYMSRMGLPEEDADFFFNPQNIAAYPFDKIKEKTEKFITIGDEEQKNIYENGKLVYITGFNKDHSAAFDKRIIENGSATRYYDQDGHISAICQEWLDNSDMWHEVHYLPNTEPFEVVKNAQLEILKVADLKGNELADAKTLQQEYAHTRQVLIDMHSDKGANQEDLQRAYSFIENDSFCLFEKKPDLLKKISQKMQENIVSNAEIKVKSTEKLQGCNKIKELRGIAPHASVNHPTQPSKSVEPLTLMQAKLKSGRSQ